MSTAPPDRPRLTRGDILQAAAAAIAAHGFHGMSMRDLAAATGTSLSNLYNYFPSKEDILFVLQKEAFEALVASAEEALATLDEPEARLYVLISHHVRYVAENPDVMRVLVHEAASLPAGQRAAVRGLKERYFQLARSIVGDLVGRGCNHSGTGGETLADPELDRVTYNVFGMLNWLYGWYRPGLHGTARDVARTIHHLVLCGVVTACPYRELQDTMEHHLDALAPSPLLAGAGAEREPR